MYEYSSTSREMIIELGNKVVADGYAGQVWEYLQSPTVTKHYPPGLKDKTKAIEVEIVVKESAW